MAHEMEELHAEPISLDRLSGAVGKEGAALGGSYGKMKSSSLDDGYVAPYGDLDGPPLMLSKEHEKAEMLASAPDSVP
ncbi:hypothetical protein Ancab_005901 [Ancistrocladus abbreviatus]